MAKKDPRIDAYIEKSQDFAKPILAHIRKLVHRACPEVEEKIKRKSKKLEIPEKVREYLLWAGAAFQNLKKGNKTHEQRR